MAIFRTSSIAPVALLALACGCGGAQTNPETPTEASTAEATPSTPPAPPPPKTDEAPKPPPAEEAKAEPAPDKPAPTELAEAPKAPSISCEPKAGAATGPKKKLEISVDRSHVDLEGHRLEVKLTRAACKVELQVIGESGKILANASKAFDGAAAGTVLAVDWSPIRAETVSRIEVWGHDTEGNYVGVAITPWNVKIDHEEVNFETDSDKIRDSEVPKLEASLDKVKDALAKHQDLKGIALYIAGHTDTVGSPEHNLNLSRKRARAIAAWFRGRGLKIPVAWEGFGEHSPIVKTGDEVAEAKNRRVDYILALDPPRLPQGAVPFGWKAL
ncbi:OmpA family protein [Polyangium mundeleinium]|uniref:OmpA family protein n=1 Tax=Polyangium mundeleinium TaxID=2995306 RepID=A0ABT5EHJ9_9BACT|nr:OmpA family protein [Polyangium mundeleinium]MDC0741293.1 OmpA family protein [Polyangium mundeleinium]